MMSFELQFKKNAQLLGDSIALMHEKKTLCYRDFFQYVEVLRMMIVNSQSDTVGTYLGNNLEWCVSDVAILLSKKISVPLPVFFTDTQIASVIRQSGIDLIVTDVSGAKSLSQIKELDVLIETISVGALQPLCLVFVAKHQVAIQSPQETCKITFTSGSTGDPKGVMLSEAHLLRVVDAIQERLSGLFIERQACLMPLSTLLENVAGLYRTLISGGTYCIPESECPITDGIRVFDAEKFHAWSSEHLPNLTIMLPHMVDECLVFYQGKEQKIPPSWQFIAVGGGMVRHQVLASLTELGFPVFQGYGLSECGGVVALNAPGEHKNGTVGQALKHVAISSAEDGEILVTGNAMLGYLGDHEKTIPTIFTGDLGLIDKDGFLTILGRKKNTIVTRMGRNISPEWIEGEVLAFPEMHQALMTGDELNDNHLILVSDASDDAIDSVILALNQTLPLYAQIDSWCRAKEAFTVENGLLTHNGRLKRHEILKIYRRERR